jgi:hypothetical protein
MAVGEAAKRQSRATRSCGHCVVALHAASDAASSTLSAQKYHVT